MSAPHDFGPTECPTQTGQFFPGEPADTRPGPQAPVFFVNMVMATGCAPVTGHLALDQFFRCRPATMAWIMARSGVVAGVNRRDIVGSLRAALAAVLSLLAARLLKMPESYWAPISTLVVLLAASNPLTQAWQRFVGTAVGAALAAVIASFFHTTWIVYGVGILICGIVCVLLRVGAAYRMAAIALTVVLLVPRAAGPWIVALHRFIEVSLGIAVAVVVEKVWPRALVSGE